MDVSTAVPRLVRAEVQGDCIHLYLSSLDLQEAGIDTLAFYVDGRFRFAVDRPRAMFMTLKLYERAEIPSCWRRGARWTHGYHYWVDDSWVKIRLVDEPEWTVDRLYDSLDEGFAIRDWYPSE